MIEIYTDFFKTIDTEEKAYWLGFIAADGNIRKDLLTCSIELKASDREHLVKFAKCFNNYYGVKDIDRQLPSAKIIISSKQCCLDLLQYGITPTKSLTLKVNMDLIPLDLQRHYIRGYFDGNGSIYCSHPNRSNGYNYEEWGMNFVGTKDVLAFFASYLDLPHPVKKTNERYFTVGCGGTLRTFEILSLLYGNSTIYLDRKKQKFEELRSSQRLSRLVSKRDYFAEEKETSILVGLILGGGCIRNLRLEKVSNKKEILRHVQNIFDEYEYKTEFKEIYNTRHQLTYKLIVQLTPEQAKHYKHQFYPNGNKTITRHLLNELNNDGLSIWLSLNSREVDSGVSLGTTKFTSAENQIIKDYFESVHKISVSLRKQREKVYIHIPKRGKEVLLRKVYVPRSTQKGEGIVP